VDAFFLTLRALLALAAVFGLIWWLKRRVGAGLGQAGAVLTVVTRRPLGPKSSVAVVDFNGRRLLLGVSETAVNVLSEAQAPAPDFSQALEKASDDSDQSDDGSAAPATEPLAGSIFAKNTWRQFFVALNGGGPR
jgi:flagellar protein FliO/FliZ